MPLIVLKALGLLRNPWILLIIACAIGAGGTGWYRMQYHDCRAARLEDENNALRAEREMVARDRERREEIDRNYQAELIRARQEANGREQEIRTAAASTCPVAPARRAYYDSVRRDQDKAGAGETRPGRVGGPKPLSR